MEKARYSAKSMETYCNTKMKHLLKGKKNDAEAVKEVLDKLEALILFGPTSERFSLLASAYKRQAMLLKFPKVTTEAKKEELPPMLNKDVLTKMTDAYKEATFLNFKKPKGGYKTPLTREEALNIKVYSLENWLMSERLLQETFTTEIEKIKVAEKEGEEKKVVAKRIAAIRRQKRKRAKTSTSILPTSTILDFIKEKMAQLEKGDNDEKEFWDFMKVVNMGQCYLLHCPATDKEYQKILAKIKTTYNSAWARGGTANNLESEITQMQFIISQLPGKANEKLVACLQELVVFFQEKL